MRAAGLARAIAGSTFEAVKMFGKSTVWSDLGLTYWDPIKVT